MFWMKSNKPEGVDVSFLERLKRLENKVSMLEGDILNLNTSVSSIRLKILKKLQLKDAETEQTSQDLYNGMFPKS